MFSYQYFNIDQIKTHRKKHQLQLIELTLQSNNRLCIVIFSPSRKNHRSIGRILSL